MLVLLYHTKLVCYYIVHTMLLHATTHTLYLACTLLASREGVYPQKFRPTDHIPPEYSPQKKPLHFANLCYTTNIVKIKELI